MKNTIIYNFLNEKFYLSLRIKTQGYHRPSNTTKDIQKKQHLNILQFNQLSTVLNHCDARHFDTQNIQTQDHRLP